MKFIKEYIEYLTEKIQSDKYYTQRFPNVDHSIVMKICNSVLAYQDSKNELYFQYNVASIYKNFLNSDLEKTIELLSTVSSQLYFVTDEQFFELIYTMIKYKFDIKTDFKKFKDLYNELRYAFNREEYIEILKQIIVYKFNNFDKISELLQTSGSKTFIKHRIVELVTNKNIELPNIKGIYLSDKETKVLKTALGIISKHHHLIPDVVSFFSDISLMYNEDSKNTLDSEIEYSIEEDSIDNLVEYIYDKFELQNKTSLIYFVNKYWTTDFSEAMDRKKSYTIEEDNKYGIRNKEELDTQVKEIVTNCRTLSIIKDLSKEQQRIIRDSDRKYKIKELIEQLMSTDIEDDEQKNNYFKMSYKDFEHPMLSNFFSKSSRLKTDKMIIDELNNILDAVDTLDYNDIKLI